MYIAIDGNMCYQATTKAELTYILPHDAELSIEPDGDSLVASLYCNIWVNKKILLQVYSAEWSHEGIRNDLAIRVYKKFGMVVYKGKQL